MMMMKLHITILSRSRKKEMKANYGTEHSLIESIYIYLRSLNYYTSDAINLLSYIGQNLF